MIYFPVFTQIEGKRCLIAGGGKVALRKVNTLLLYGADVVVTAKKVCDEIKELLPEKNIFEEVSDLNLSEHLQKEFLKNAESSFLEEEIQKAFLVVAATSSREENHRVAKLCHARHILVNVADSEEESSFIFPAVVRKGNISIGINSGTGSPAVSKQIRQQIEKAVPDYYADIAIFLGELRQYVKANFKEEAMRRYILKTAAARAFSKERVLTENEIKEIIRQGQND